MLRGSARHLVWAACAVALMVACGRATPPLAPSPSAPAATALIGLADFHTHQFGYLGFGGDVLSHSVDPQAPCLPVPAYDVSTLRVKDVVRQSLFKEAAAQARLGQCYPTVSNIASQRMDTDNLRRAWRYGLRLMVVLATNFEFICNVAELASPCPSDREALEVQIAAAKTFEAQIDAESGGPGQGWYHIVYSPAEARATIAQGKLAVVLGVEAANTFGGCRTVPAGTVPAIQGGAPETTWAVSCAQPNGMTALQTQEALALFEHYWQLGVRDFFPIHSVDGTAGGAAFFAPTLHAVHNPSRLGPATMGQLGTQLDNMILAVRPPMTGVDCKPLFAFDGGRCNALGLTDTGRDLIRLMAAYGAIIDVDHMSHKAKTELLGKAGLLGGAYPFVSSHSGILALNHGDDSNEGQLTLQDFQDMIPAGSAFAPILPPVEQVRQEDTYPAGATVAPHNCGGTSESWVQAYRYVVDQLKASQLNNGGAPFVGVGFGTDFGSPAPVGALGRYTDIVQSVVEYRDVRDVTGLFTPHSGIPGGHCYVTTRAIITATDQLHVSYPFTSTLAPGVLFDRSTTPWGNRATPYDISFDGVPHVGMLPDFVAELQALGLTDDDLQPLWHGAEAYIREWEAATNSNGSRYNPEINAGIAGDCRALRAELLKVDLAHDWTAVSVALDQLKTKGCFGF